MTIKVISLSDLQCRELRGHDGTVRALAFDPQLEYLVRGHSSELPCCSAASSKLTTSCMMVGLH